MRAVLTNTGSTGDLQPLLALAEEMRRRGHQPVFALMPFFKERIQRLGFAFTPVGEDVDFGALQRQTVRHWTRHEHAETVVETMWSEFEELLETSLPRTYGQLAEACQNADVLVSGPLQPASRMVHELTQIPFASIQLTHFAGKDMAVARRLLADPVNRLRADHGLPPLEDPWRSDANSPQLALYAMSRFIRKPDPDWSDHYHVIGFLFAEEPECKPDPALQAFIQAGEPPIAVTFGSMTHDDPETLTQKILASVEESGSRAIIQHGWSGLARTTRLPETVFAVDFVPHDWLFRHVAAVVHHGGAGTTAAVWKAGVPGIIVPHAFDQQVWAELSRGMGLSPTPFSIRALTISNLADSIRAVLHQPHFRENALRFSRDIRSEGGVVRALDLIEKLVAEKGRIDRQTPLSDEADRSARTDRRKMFLKNRRVRSTNG